MSEQRPQLINDITKSGLVRKDRSDRLSDYLIDRGWALHSESHTDGYREGFRAAIDTINTMHRPGDLPITAHNHASDPPSASPKPDFDFLI